MECDHAVALIDDAEYGNNCGCGPVICGVLREFSVYSRCSWPGECVVATVC